MSEAAPPVPVPVLLMGATGTVGRHVAAALTRRGMPWRAMVRDVARARAVLGAVLGPDAMLLPGDLARPGTLPPLMQGVERLYLASSVSPEQVALQSAAIGAAAQAGVRHVVKLSNLGADPASDFATARWHGEIEATLEASGMAWTHLRPHMFMQNLLLMASAVRESGALAGAYGAARIAPVDARDVAAVAAACLCEDGLENRHWGRAYELTGPVRLGFDEIAAALGTVLKREVAYVPLQPAEARQRMIIGGRPEWYADALLAVYAKWAAGEAPFAQVSDAVQQVTGRPATPLAQFLADHTAALRGV